MVLRTEKGPGRYMGTCFPFRWRHRFLTARHCVADHDAADVIVRSQYGRDFRVVNIHRHPTVDIALLEGDPIEGGVPYPAIGLHRFEGTYGVGDEIVTFGFPVGGTLVEPDEPTPRMFRGFTQRIGDFASGGSAPYRAYELSFPAPAGLSGGPVFALSAPDRVFAMVTGLMESYTIADEQVIEQTDDHSHLLEARRIISYGMALSLWQEEQWLREVAPLAGDARW
jgi:hypothetical protein